MEDLACLFNATLIDKFNTFEKGGLDYEDFGTAQKVEIDEMETFFITKEKKTKEHIEKIDKRVDLIKSHLEKATGVKKQLLEDRLNRLAQNLLLIKIGGRFEVEQHETKDKLTDALNSVTNCIKYGILPGGGAALLHASRILQFVSADNEDEQAGIELLKEICQEPMFHLCDNQGLNGRHFVEKLLEEQIDPWIGFDIKKKRFGNMREMGIIDSYWNLKNILTDACSVGGMLLTSSAVVSRTNRYIPTALNKYKKEPF